MATDAKGNVIEEIELYPGLRNRESAEAFLESCMQDPRAEFIAAELRRIYPKCLVTTRMRIK
jgi:DNA-binding phage protein